MHEEEQTSLTFKLDSKSYRFGMPIIGDAHKDDSEKDVFYEIFGRYSESGWSARLWIKLCLALSLILFIIVLGQHIFNGGVFAWNWILGLIC